VLAKPSPTGGLLVPTEFTRSEFKVMGTESELIMSGPGAPPVELLQGRLCELEERWSRFLPNSELSLIGNSAPRRWILSPDTSMLIERAIWAWTATGGLFDPTVRDAVIAAGYVDSFEHLQDQVPTMGAALAAPGCADIELDSELWLLRLPKGVSIDPGGIGKGLAADLVAVLAVELGAESACVSLGGDLRVAGAIPVQGWELELDHQIAPLARVNLHSGAIATSSTLRRRWSTTTGIAHHVMDPRTGRPSTGSAVACSVIAGAAWWAEAVATALLVGWGDPETRTEELLELLEYGGALITRADGEQLRVGRYRESFSLGARSSQNTDRRSA